MKKQTKKTIGVIYDGAASSIYVEGNSTIFDKEFKEQIAPKPPAISFVGGLPLHEILPELNNEKKTKILVTVEILD